MSKNKLETSPECSVCKKFLDGFTAMDKKSKPKDGDFSICLYCGTLGKYSDGLTRLVKLSKQEEQELAKNDPKMYNEIFQALMLTIAYKNRANPS